MPTRCVVRPVGRTRMAYEMVRPAFVWVQQATEASCDLAALLPLQGGGREGDGGKCSAYSIPTLALPLKGREYTAGPRDPYESPKNLRNRRGRSVIVGPAVGGVFTRSDAVRRETYAAWIRPACPNVHETLLSRATQDQA